MSSEEQLKGFQWGVCGFTCISVRLPWLLSGEWTGQEQERKQGAREEIHVVGHGEGIN